jgi:TatD DNase family protein
MYIDSHAHLTSSQISDVESLVQRAQEQGVEKIINICTDIESLEKGLHLCKRHPFIFNTAATTPHDVEKEGELFFPYVVKAARQSALVAIGETGLDYHYAHSPKEMQKSFFIRYLHLAHEMQLPLVIHCREAFSDLFEIVESESPEAQLLLHCFTGTLEDARRALERNWSLSFSGIITFKKSEALREVAKYVPIDHILVETDTPYLAPQSKRGLPNEPAFLPEIVTLLANLKGLELATVAKSTLQNASKFFSLEKKSV